MSDLQPEKPLWVTETVDDRSLREAIWNVIKWLSAAPEISAATYRATRDPQVPSSGSGCGLGDDASPLIRTSINVLSADIHTRVDASSLTAAELKLLLDTHVSMSEAAVERFRTAVRTIADLIRGLISLLTGADETKVKLASDSPSSPRDDFDNAWRDFVDKCRQALASLLRVTVRTEYNESVLFCDSFHLLSMGVGESKNDDTGNGDIQPKADAVRVVGSVEVTDNDSELFDALKELHEKQVEVSGEIMRKHLEAIRELIQGTRADNA